MLLKQKIIFVVQLLSYLALIPMFMYSNLNEWMITIGIYCLLFGIGISLSYHRNITHKMLNIKWRSPNQYKLLRLLNKENNIKIEKINKFIDLMEESKTI